MLQALDRYFRDIAIWNKPSGGFYIWCKLKKAVDMDNVFEKARKQFLLLNPGNLYDFEENHALRLSYAYIKPEEVFPAIGQLAEIIKEEITKK